MQLFEVEDMNLKGDGAHGGYIRKVSKKIIDLEPNRYKPAPSLKEVIEETPVVEAPIETLAVEEPKRRGRKKKIN